jgi:chemotaxis protein methyltransferase CheR
MPESRDPKSILNQGEFSFICQYVYDYAGIVLNESKREMLYRRFARIVRDRKLDSFSAYCKLLKKNPEQEKNYFINAVTTNLTSFFREKHHFDHLTEHELPALLKTNSNSKQIRIWSSACSTGEEPYSIAIGINEALKTLARAWDVKVLATDIDSNVLATAQQGIYDQDKIDNLSDSLKSKYFNQGKGKNTSLIKVATELTDLITFKQLNLLDDWPMQRQFDVIFCRNVLIYFDKSTQQELFARFYDCLKPGGLLLLGHSENLGAFQSYFKQIGRTMYRKPLVAE